MWFLLKSLATVLRKSRLPQAIIEAMAIWTHVAGQTTDQAPSPLAFVPALMHSVGAFYPSGGIRQVPHVLEQIAMSAGVKIHYRTKVKRIRLENRKVLGVETNAGDFVAADAVVSNAPALSTYLELATLNSGAPRFARLPLQSPGVCAYLAVRSSAASSYLRFRVPGGNELCRLLISPAVMNEAPLDGWQTARLLAPLSYEDAARGGDAGQRDYLDRVLAESWWRNGVGEIRVLHKRSAIEWGAEYNLYANSMNPVMTARFMRAGRFSHRSPYGKGLYLAGSSTHPGQWVSFCAISGILAAGCVIEDLG
jgi:phytoene dehydrogenase-like protein